MKHKDGFWWHIIIDVTGTLILMFIFVVTKSTLALILSSIMVLMTIADYQTYTKTKDELDFENDFKKRHSALMNEQRSRAFEQLEKSRKAREQFNK